LLPAAVGNFVEHELASAAKCRITFDAHELTSWDSSVLTFLVKFPSYAGNGESPWIVKDCRRVQKLLALAEVVPERKAPAGMTEASFLERLGTAPLALPLR